MQHPLSTLKHKGYAPRFLRTMKKETLLRLQPNEGMEETEARHRLECCLADVRLWMAANFLKLNDDKTDFLVVGSKSNLAKSDVCGIKIGQTQVEPSNNVKNIGAVLDSHLTMEKQVIVTCKSAWYHLFQLSKIKKHMSQEQLKSAVLAYVISKLDQNNSLLVGLPDILINKLQRVQNAAARMITGSNRYEEAKHLLFQLHWLPISFRIDFKILLLTFKSIHGEGPEYLRELLLEYAPGKNLCSSSRDHLVQLHTQSKQGDTAFSAAAPRLWNSLPEVLSLPLVLTVLNIP